MLFIVNNSSVHMFVYKKKLTLECLIKIKMSDFSLVKYSGFLQSFNPVKPSPEFILYVFWV